MTTRPSRTANLSREEELQLARAWRDHRDERARTKILDAYHKLAVGFASKALRPGMDLDDLIQVAKMGLLSALDKFDPELGYGFSTFARYYVLSGLQVHALENAGPVRIFNTAASKTLLASYFHLRRIYEDPNSGHLSQQGREKICLELDIDMEQIQRFEMVMSIPTGIDAGAGESDEEGAIRGHTLIAEENPENDVLDKKAIEQARQSIKNALSDLQQRDAEILIARHLSDTPETLDGIALRLGISRERVRQLEMRALKQVRESLQQAGITGARNFFQ